MNLNERTLDVVAAGALATTSVPLLGKNVHSQLLALSLVAVKVTSPPNAGRCVLAVKSKFVVEFGSTTSNVRLFVLVLPSHAITLSSRVYFPFVKNVYEKSLVVAEVFTGPVNVHSNLVLPSALAEVLPKATFTALYNVVDG